MKTSHSNFDVILSKTAEERKEDTLEDSEVLKMLQRADVSDESTGLRRMSGGRRSIDSQGDGEEIYRHSISMVGTSFL